MSNCYHVKKSKEYVELKHGFTSYKQTVLKALVNGVLSFTLKMHLGLLARQWTQYETVKVYPHREKTDKRQPRQCTKSDTKKRTN